MTWVELINSVLWSLTLLAVYFLVSFGPGFIIGILVANFIFGRNQPTLMKQHKEKIKAASKHNSQWHPEHERWKES